MKIKLLTTQGGKHSELISKVARCSTNRMDYEKSPDEQFKFIESLWARGHHTPFEFITFSYLIKDVSRALTHQLVRHRLCSFVQESQRYVRYDENSPIWDKFVFPEVLYNTMEGFEVDQLFCEIKKLYGRLIKSGIKPEDARCILPNATPTTICMHFNLRHFLSVIYPLRSDTHAQAEIRKLINCIFDDITTFYDKKDSVMKDFIVLRERK